jgi:hypothetical protein
MDKKEAQWKAIQKREKNGKKVEKEEDAFVKGKNK